MVALNKPPAREITMSYDDFMGCYEDFTALDDAATWEEDRIAEDREGQDYDDPFSEEAYELSDAMEAAHMNTLDEDVISGAEDFEPLF